MKRISTWAVLTMLVGIAWGGGMAACAEQEGNGALPTDTLAADSLRIAKIKADSIAAAKADSVERYRTLTDADFALVAEELGIEVAAMKAVVAIEAGAAMKGFLAPGVPVINYDPSMYRIYASKAPNKAGDKNAKVPEGLSGYGLKEWKQLTNARHKNRDGADMATFWGMFQIGGFNYKICGCETVQEFVEKMSYSELAQLELFAKFLISTGYVKYLRAKDWTTFARRYNGPSYARRGYHTRMAAAYKKFSAKPAETK